MRSKTTLSIKQFAKRHHLVVDFSVKEDDAYPPDSVFRHKNSYDEIAAYGLVHKTDIRLAQHRLLASTNGQHHLTTLMSSLVINPGEIQALFLHRSLSAAHALSIKHLRGLWSHNHQSSGQLFTPTPTSLSEHVRERIVNDSFSVEVTPRALIVAAYPALETDAAVEGLLSKLFEIFEVLQN